MLIQNLAGVTKWKYLQIEELDDDVFYMIEDDTIHSIVEDLILDTWVHVTPLLPNPELDKVLWEIINIYSKYELREEKKEEV